MKKKENGLVAVQAKPKSKINIVWSDQKKKELMSALGKREFKEFMKIFK